ncbi:hypothetical protein DH2020_011432 [Rehmannia glutinosa]|uniref:Uncharacterized protein n=1 Tax=Rehmannia glutinosa TaxID=99300 RepID=A0ABR0XDF3_REHGL
MDVKALAKSKRAHSNHHSKKHNPHQASKAISIASDSKKPTGKQAKGKPPQSHVSKPLPSNWERYDENLDLISEEAQPSSSQPTEFVVPKSKGADYAHIISEAKDQSRASYSSDVLPLFDDVINGMSFAFDLIWILVQCFLLPRGQNILSWIADDDFDFEDKPSTSVEAPFLLLNLNALAEQLAKAKLSDRCFIEPDLLPLELLDDELQACDEDKHDPQTHTSAAETDSRASSLGYNQEFSKNVQQYREPASSSVTVARNIPVQTSEEGLKPLNQNKDEIFQSQETDRSISAKSISERIINSTTRNSSIFQASNAEAELDMLLSSFNETRVLESPSASSSIEIPSIGAVPSEIVKNGTHMMKSAIIDDDIDNLLEETSVLTKIEDIRLSNEVKASADVISSTLNPSSKSKLLDDFDSWLDTI